MTTKEGLHGALRIIGMAGLVGTVVVAPNAVQAYGLLVTKLIRDESTRKRIYKELKRRGLIQVSAGDDGTYNVGITLDGARKLLSLSANEITITPMKKWDGHWRLVCFDIPKGKDSERLYFNRRLHELGFTMLQRSMWVHPFECIDEIRSITDFVNLTRYVSVIEVIKLDDRNTRFLLQKYEHILHS